MQYFLRLFTRILLLRATPAEVPYSPVLFWLTFLVHLTVALALGLFLMPFLENLAFNAVNQGMLLLFVFAALYFVRHRPRFMQTASAVLGVNVLFYFLDLPAYGLLVSRALPDEHILMILSALYHYALLVYNVVVLGHILRHAMDVSTVVGVLVALGYYVANIWFMRTVFLGLTQ